MTKSNKSVKIEDSLAGGFTFIEVLIALAIFSVGFIGAAKAMRVAVDSTGIAWKTTETINQTQLWAERLMALDQADPLLDDSETGIIVPAVDQMKARDWPKPPDGFTIAWEVQTIDDSNQNQIMKIITVIGRYCGKGIERKVRLKIVRGHHAES